MCVCVCVCVCLCVCVCVKTRVVLLLHCTKMSIQNKDIWSFCVLFFLSDI